MTPVLSVLMITFNHEAFIGRSIESVLQQKTDFNFELVIGDDHSTDNTARVAKHYADKYPDRIKLLSHQNNLGVIPNFQHTLQRCKGKYIAMLEGDDRWIDETKLQKQVNFLESNPEFVLCGGHTISESTNKTFVYNVIRQFKYLRQRSLKLQTYELDEVIIANHFKTLTVVFRSEFLRHPLNPVFYSSTILDWLIYISLGLNKGNKARYANLPHILAAYNVHAGGIFSGTSTVRRLQIFADVRNCISEATDNKFFGYHYPVLILNETGSFPKDKKRFISKLNDVYDGRMDINMYNGGDEEVKEIIRNEISSADIDIEKLGYYFSRVYLSSPNFDEFTCELLRLMNTVNSNTKNYGEKVKLLRAMSGAWRACMFYEKFSTKTIYRFMGSLLSKYGDIYVYTLILTYFQNSKR
jgi:glycosyltransferase involved in cell wall biosynthesis